MKKYVCDVCGWIYDPEVGDPEGGIAPGTAFEDIPDDWGLLLFAGVGKEDFSLRGIRLFEGITGRKSLKQIII